jgi:hypothetical protein
MPIVIFYSWQSDRDPKTTRYFIREALDLAVRRLAREMDVEEVLRVDQDTQGVPGHPEIFRTICEKIESCAIFVADLTYVGMTEIGDSIPNPNVAIELGYALKSIGPDRYIAVMNTEYGGPENLPFDLKHRRWPIPYHLPPNSPVEERNSRRQELVNQFAGAIRSIIESGVQNTSASLEQVVVTPSTTSPAIYYDETKPFAIRDDEKGVELRVLRGAKMYLRLIPTQPAEELSTADASDIARISNLEPMRDAHTPTGITWVRNQYGAAAVAMNWETGEVFTLSQLLKRTREIWGVDALTINEEHCKEWSKVEFGYFPCSSVEKTFDASLTHYIRVAKDHLSLLLPLRFIVGVDGVTGFKMALPSGHWGRFGGRMVEDHIRYEGKIENFDVDTHDLLLPFYKKLWRECGLTRPEGKI